MYEKCNIEFGHCVYCGKFKTITKDHIPPKNLFPKPRPNNLIRVPSCYACNLGSSKDDEYFRFSISIREDIFANNSIKGIYPKVIRSLMKPNKLGFRKSFIKSIGQFENYSKAGIFLGYKHSYDVDLCRLNKVASRIAKGLFYYHFDRILSDEYCMESYILDALRNMDPRILFALKENLLDPISKNKLISIGDVFEYKYSVSIDEPNMSAWVMRFYRKIYFISLSYKKNGN